MSFDPLWPSMISDFDSYEEGRMTEEEFILFFQRLINSGLAWSLQGRYGRTAADLIEQGLCEPQQQQR